MMDKIAKYAGDSAELKLELDTLHIGMLEKCTDTLKDCPLHVPSLTRFVQKKFRAWPRRLIECADYAEGLDMTLLAASAQFYSKLEEEGRKEALYRLTIWQTWENKYQDKFFADNDCGIVITGIKRHKALTEKSQHTVGHIINHLAKGDLKLDEVTTDKVWKVFSGFMSEMRDPYLLEPLRRKGLLPEPEPEPEQGREA